MIKGMVMEIKDEYVIVMREDGVLARIKNKEGLKVGTSIYYFEEDVYTMVSNTNVIPFKRYFAPLVAVAALFIILINPIMSIFKSSINSTYAVVTIDVNPSIQFDLDETGLIADVNGINDDASKLELSTLKGLTFEEGSKLLKDILSANNYLDNKNSMLIGFSFLGNDDIAYEERIQNTIKGIFNDVEVAFLKGTEADLKEAESKGISLGKYQALLKLEEDNFEDAIENLTTQEILDMLKNIDGSLFLNEEQLEELQDELEDREEDQNEDSDDDDNYDDEQDNRDESSNDSNDDDDLDDLNNEEYSDDSSDDNNNDDYDNNNSSDDDLDDDYDD